MSKKDRHPVTVYFVGDDPSDMEIWNWMEQNTSNKNAFIKKVLYHQMMSEKRAVNVHIHNNIGAVAAMPAQADPEPEEQEMSQEEKDRIINSGLPMDDDE